MLRRLLDEPFAYLRPLPSEELKFFVLQLIGRDKEFFNFFADLFGQSARVLFRPLTMRITRHGNQTVVANFLFANFFLENLKNADDLAFQDKARRRCSVMQNKDVDWIANTAVALTPADGGAVK